jgi:hypothetical protein
VRGLIRRLAGSQSPLLSLTVLLVLVVGLFWRHILFGYTFPFDYTATSHMAVFIANTVGSGHFTQ